MAIRSFSSRSAASSSSRPDRTWASPVAPTSAAMPARVLGQEPSRPVTVRGAGRGWQLAAQAP